MVLEQNELGWLANHLGHDVKTRKEFYKKFSKMLLATEYGKMSQYAGKNMNDTDFEGNQTIIS